MHFSLENWFHGLWSMLVSQNFIRIMCAFNFYSLYFPNLLNTRISNTINEKIMFILIQEMLTLQKYSK